MQEFERFQSNFDTLASAITRNIALSGENPQVLKECDAQVYEMKGLINEIAISVRYYQYNDKEACKKRLAIDRKQFSNLKREIEAARDRSAFGGRRGQGNNRAQRSMNKQQRQALLRQGDTMGESTSSLDRTINVLAETEELGRATHGNLERQTEQISNTLEDVNHMSTQNDRSKTILRSMKRKVMTNKMTQAVIILLELCVLAFIIYLKCYDPR